MFTIVHLGAFLLLVVGTSMGAPEQDLTDPYCAANLTADIDSMPICDAIKKYYKCVHTLYTGNQQWQYIGSYIMTDAERQLGDRGCEYNMTLLFGEEARGRDITIRSATNSTRGTSVGATVEPQIETDCSKNLEINIGRLSMCEAFTLFYQCLQKNLMEKGEWSFVAENFKANTKAQFSARGCEYNETLLFGTDTGSEGTSAVSTVEPHTEADCSKNLEINIRRLSMCEAFTLLYQCLQKINMEKGQWSFVAEHLKANAKAQFSARGCEYDEALLFGEEATGTDTATVSWAEGLPQSFKDEALKCYQMHDFTKSYSSLSATCKVVDQFSQCLLSSMKKVFDDVSSFRKEFDKSAKSQYEALGCKYNSEKFFGNGATYSTSSCILTLLSLSMSYIFLRS